MTESNHPKVGDHWAYGVEGRVESAAPIVVHDHRRASPILGVEYVIDLTAYDDQPPHVDGQDELSPRPLPLHRTEAGWPRCSTCDGGGCPDCTDPA